MQILKKDKNEAFKGVTLLRIGKSCKILSFPWINIMEYIDIIDIHTLNQF